MVDNLKTIFECTALVLGILFMLTVIIAIVTTPIREHQKKKELDMKKQQFDKYIEELRTKLEEELKEEKKKKTTRKTTKKTTKKEEK